jgi:hypothetical protein
VLDETDEWLRKGPYWAAYEWLASANNVAFDPDARAKYRRISQDHDALHDEIERESMMWERMVNFEI